MIWLYVLASFVAFLYLLMFALCKTAKTADDFEPPRPELHVVRRDVA